ncbi:hypothetical protein SDC9_128421 [bioreactor metagenome]|uniref:Uncharacterized protein n=1 Tax=bioreactor metagenome TaxID=1076179 RepID=A0A645CWY8_9ZZZZ
MSFLIAKRTRPPLNALDGFSESGVNGSKPLTHFCLHNYGKILIAEQFSETNIRAYAAGYVLKSQHNNKAKQGEMMIFIVRIT